jgi:hypothetical protein
MGFRSERQRAAEVTTAWASDIGGKACGRLRRRGRHSFRALFLRGKRGCDLLVDAESLTGATRLHDRVGMSAHPRFAIWEKELHPASQATDT